MKKLSGLFLSALFVLSSFCTSARAQDSEPVNNFRQQFSGHFEYASRVLQLAKSMPAENYDWRPDEGVMSIEEVYTHIARYNFYYPASSLGIPAPENMDMDKVESITGKEEVVSILEQSINHLKKIVKEMPDSKFSEPAKLYGRTVNGQAVLMQLVTHMSEHVGQSIAYARMNGVVPPWSR